MSTNRKSPIVGRVIFSEDEGLFWSNEDGWVSLSNATVFDFLPDTVPTGNVTILMFDEAAKHALLHRLNSPKWDLGDVLDSIPEDFEPDFTSLDRDCFYQALDEGDEVFVRDPDGNLSTGFYKIVSMNDPSGERHEETVASLVNDAGSTYEAYLSELA